MVLKLIKSDTLCCVLPIRVLFRFIYFGATHLHVVLTSDDHQTNLCSPSAVCSVMDRVSCSLGSKFLSPKISVIDQESYSSLNQSRCTTENRQFEINKINMSKTLQVKNKTFISTYSRYLDVHQNPNYVHLLTYNFFIIFFVKL